MPVVKMTYTKNNEEVFTYSYFLSIRFSKTHLVDLKEELTIAIAIADQLDGKLDYDKSTQPNALLNPIELTDERYRRFFR